MTPKSYVDHLGKLGLTPYSAGPILGIDKRTSYRYAAGADIPEPVAILLRKLVGDAGKKVRSKEVPCPLCGGRGKIPKED